MASLLRIHPPLLWSAATVLPAAQTLVVGARFVARHGQKVSLGADDWLTIPALLLVWGMGVMITYATANHATGYPTPPVAGPTQVLTTASPQQILTEKAVAVVFSLATASVTCTKLSIMIFYRRTFRLGTQKAVNTIMDVANSIILLWGIAYFFSFILACREDIADLWSTTADAFKCTSSLPKIDLSLAISDMIIDVFVLLFPIPLILHLHLSGAKKLAIIGVFTLGAAALAASVERLAIIVEELAGYGASETDADFASTAAVYFVFLEAGIALITVCLPSVVGLFKIKAVQAVLGGVLSYFHSLSASSRASRAGRIPSNDDDRDSTTRKGLKSTASKTTSTRTNSKQTSTVGNHEFEMDSFPTSGITVNHSIEQRVEEV